MVLLSLNKSYVSLLLKILSLTFQRPWDKVKVFDGFMASGSAYFINLNFAIPINTKHTFQTRISVKSFHSSAWHLLTHLFDLSY